MPLEDRIRSSVDQALGTLVREVLEHAAEEQNEATRSAREAAIADAERAAQARAADAEARIRASMDQAVERARAEERDAAARETRSQVESEGEQKMRDQLAAADNRMKAALADADARAAEAVKTAVAAARVRERELELVGVTRLLESVRGLDGASSLSEVLDVLATAAAKEAARAAVVVLRGDRIQGWKMSGFGSRDSQPKLVDLALAEAGVIGIAISAARVVSTRDAQGAAAGPGFETLADDRMGLAVPVIVGGRVVAVVYADGVSMDGHAKAVPSGWPELIEVLTRHAGRCLEALTTQKAPATRYPAASSVGAKGTSPGETPASVGNAN